MTTYEKIGLDVVVYDAKFARCRGTLSQLVVSLDDMRKRIASTESQNDYQKVLYTQIQKQCTEVYEKYIQLVNDINPSDYSAFGYYLNGPQNNGKRRATTNFRERKRYENSEFKETIRSVDDRLRHIKNDCIRKVRDSGADGSDNELNNRIIAFTDSLHQFVQTSIEQWNTTVSSAREANQQNDEVHSNVELIVRGRKINDDSQERVASRRNDRGSGVGRGRRGRGVGHGASR